jgi:hypothetical protein
MTSTPGELQSMLTAENHLAILDVMARHSNYCDLFQLDEAAQTMTENVVISLKINGAEPPLQVSGPRAFVATLESRHRFHQQHGITVRHLMHNQQVLEAGADSARMFAQVMVVYHRPTDASLARPLPVQCSNYEYSLRKIEGTWLIAALSIEAVGEHDSASLYGIDT